MDLRPNIRLKTVLLQRGITQRDLGFGTNIDESRISRIIKGYEKPSSEIKEIISEFLNIDIEKLFLD